MASRSMLLYKFTSFKIVFTFYLIDNIATQVVHSYLFLPKAKDLQLANINQKKIIFSFFSQNFKIIPAAGQYKPKKQF